MAKAMGLNLETHIYISHLLNSLQRVEICCAKTKTVEVNSRIVKTLSRRERKLNGEEHYLHGIIHLRCWHDSLTT